jgi:peroxiredoxin
MSPRRHVGAAVAIASLAVFTVWITWRAKQLEKGSSTSDQAIAVLNKQAPDFSLPSSDGRTISARDYRGKKLVLIFWASWCRPCRLELPLLRSFYDRAHKPEADFEMLAISLDEFRESAEAAAKQAKLPFPVLFDSSQKTAGAYGVHSIPALMIIDKRGQVTHGEFGFNSTTQFSLATQLGIDFNTIGPKTSGDPDAASKGGPDGKPSH